MNHEDLERFLEDYGKDILSFCKYLTKNKEEAEDLCQDALVKGFEMADRIEDDAHAKGFFLAIAVRLWKNRRRKYAWRHRIIHDRIFPIAETELALCTDADMPEQTILQHEEQAFVRECVDSLSEKKRLVVLLYYMEGLKERQIAEVLQIPEGTVKSRLHQARTELSVLLSEQISFE